MSARIALLLLLLTPLLAAAPLPAGWEPEGPTLVFAGHDLYGHINGGAELFHEFGFEELRVADYRNAQGAELSVEVYRMASPRDALGIYLAKCGKERPHPDLGMRNTANRYQLTVVKGDRFAQVNNFGGDTSHRDAMKKLALGALDKVEAVPTDSLFALLHEAWPHPHALVPGSLRFLHGTLALEALHSFPGEDPLRLGDEIYGVAGRFFAETGVAQRTVIVVDYPDIATAQSVFKGLVTDPKRVRHSSGEERHSYFEGTDAQGRQVELRVSLRRLRVIVH